MTPAQMFWIGWIGGSVSMALSLQIGRWLRTR